MKKQIRKHIFVNSQIQLKLLFLILLSVLIPTFLTFLSLHYLMQSILTNAKVHSDTMHTTLLFVSNQMFAILVIGFIFIATLLAAWGLIFIHRIVGPLYRLEIEVDKIIAGKKTQKIRFRKNDYYASLASKINILIEKVQGNA